MVITLTIQGYLIYATMAAMLAAGTMMPFRKTRWLGWAAYVAGAILAAGSYGWRWYATGHVPMQNVFEALLLTAALLFPLTLVARRVGAHLEAADPWLALIVLFPLGFILPEAVGPRAAELDTLLFVPHVLCYMLAYAIMAKASFQAARLLITGDTALERQTYHLARLALPFLTAGLLLGGWWGHLAWTRHWGWDPKELLSLASWLMVLVYLHSRGLLARQPRTRGAIVLVAMALMVLTLLSNYLPFFPGMHSYAR